MITKEQRLINEAKRRETQAKADKYANELKKKITPAERAIRKELIRLNVKFQFQKYYFNTEGQLYILDFYFKAYYGRWAVEIDGKYHDDPKQKEYDLKRTQWLFERRKTQVMRFKYNEGKSSGSWLYGVIPSRGELKVEPLIKEQDVFMLYFYDVKDAETSMKVNRNLWLKYWLLPNVEVFELLK